MRRLFKAIKKKSLALVVAASTASFAQAAPPGTGDIGTVFQRLQELVTNRDIIIPLGVVAFVIAAGMVMFGIRGALGKILAALLGVVLILTAVSIINFLFGL